jgi:hypothetical protein
MASARLGVVFVSLGLVLAGPAGSLEAQTVTTIAGSGGTETLDGPALIASFGTLTGIAVDASGVVYVTQEPTAVRRVVPDGFVTTYVEEVRHAYFWDPTGIAVDARGDLYVSDLGDGFDGGDVLRIHPGSGAEFYGGGLYVDGLTALTMNASGELYFLDRYVGLGVIRVNGWIEPLIPGVIGTGIVQVAPFVFYVSDTEHHRVLVVDPIEGATTLAGTGAPGFADGVGAAAQFNAPRGLALDPHGNLFVADSGNHRIRKITPSGVVTTVAGTGAPGFQDGAGSVARFDTPIGIARAASGALYVADQGNRRIRKIVLASGCAQCDGRWIVPATARVAGAGGSFWTSELTLHNGSSEAANVRLTFLGNGDDTRGRPEAAVSIPPLRSVSMPDVLSSAFGIGAGFGALEVRADTGWLAVRSRTSTAGARGTVGDSIPGLPVASFFGQTTSPSPSLIGLREDDGFRSNLVLVNAAPVAITVVVRANDGAGAPIGERSYEMPALGMVQDPSFLRRPEFGSVARTNVSVSISSPSAGASFTAVATVIDNASNDPVTVLPQ